MNAAYERVIETLAPMPMGFCFVLDGRVWRVVKVDGLYATLQWEPSVAILH